MRKGKFDRMDDARLDHAGMVLREALLKISGIGFNVRAAGDPDDLLSLLDRGLIAFDKRRTEGATNGRPDKMR